MVKVECESCKAPFQIDERRIPPAGLKMRCPKCGHSFLVPSPSAADPAIAGPSATPPAAAGVGPRVPGASPSRTGLPGASPRPMSANNLKSTMVGVGGGFFTPPLPGGPPAGPPGSAPPAPAPPGAAKAVPVASVKAPAPKPSAGFGRKTMVGIAPEALPRGPMPPSPAAPQPPVAPPVASKPAAPLPRAAAKPAPDPVSDFPAALGALDEPDLPVVSVGLPVAGKAPPGAPAKPARPVKAPPPPALDPVEDLDFDLPALPSDLPAAKPAAAKPGPPRQPAPPARTAAPAPTAAAPAPVAAPSSFDADLPVPVSDLPAARKAAVEASQAAFLSDLPVIATHDLPARLDVGLPVVAASLPTASRGSNLPALASSLPARSGASLPSVAASLPAKVDPRAHLPSPAASLPVPRDSVPAPAAAGGGRGFGEIELPTVGESYPPAGPAPVSAGQKAAESAFGLFGEIDLPHESPPSSPRPRAGTSAPPVDPADFGDLELDDRRRSVRSPAVASIAPPGVRSDAPMAAGGMNFGEVDIGGSGADASSIGLDAPERHHGLEAPLDASLEASVPIGTVASAPARGPAAVPPAPDEPRKRSVGKAIGLGLFFVALAGGGALQLTPYGAFGNLVIGDYLHAGDYRRATAAAIADADKAGAVDTYDAAKATLEGTYAAQGRAARNKSLSAFAAFADLSLSSRFGPDPARPSRGKQLLASIPTDAPVLYADAAAAAQTADAGDQRAARIALDAAIARTAPGDPIQLDLALMAGNLALAVKDAPGATAAFTRALALSNDARAHFGLARADDLAGDAAGVKKELDATLAASPGHAGALTLRARPKSVAVDPAKGLADLAVVLEGASRAKASPQELSTAYAARAWISLERGSATDAREAFAQAVGIDPRNLDALNGQGRLFLNEERPAEALARFDTALGVDPNSPETIANDAEAKMALERLADAKDQLVAARAAFPKSVPILILLGRVEQHLGNNDAADADLRAAIALVDPARPDAVLPYVALSKLLSERGRLADARTTLDEAKKKLLPSPALERALGQISELQGDYEGAIAHFNAAVAKDSKDPTSHFLLGVALRRVRKFDGAGAELDKVAAVDKDYPGLSLERGLLFEESGDVEKAIEQFNGALAKAPDDPDLQLRVGAAYVVIGRPDDALPMLRKVLDKRPSSAEAHHFLGRALMLKGGQSQTDALRYLKRAVDLDPNRAEFHVYVAWAANDATPAQLELARDEIDRALALDNLNPEAYWQRGVLERMEGAVEDAVKDENHALALRPSRYEARATLAECFEDKTQDAAALVEWAKAIAGDAEGPDADPVRHPYWRYRYGKLLMDKAGPAVALAQLLPAANTAEKISPKPGWLAPLEFITAEALKKTGKRADAIEHYKRFLEIAPVNSPDRLDAQQALASLSPR
jgi:predicted Zn finger-like uncharacterized protein